MSDIIYTTKKRSIGAFILFAVILCGVCVRMFFVATGSYSAAAASQSSYTVNVDTMRGTIYDCNMQPLTNAKRVKKAVLTPTPGVITALYEQLDEEKADDLAKRLKSGKPVLSEVPAGFEAEGAYGVFVYERYSEEKTASHIIGYLDSTGEKGVCGIERAYNDLLCASGGMKFTFTCDAAGRTLAGIPPEMICNGYADCGDIQLTIDSSLQSAAQKALQNSGQKACAMAVVDVKSGDIRALASFPDFSQNDPETALENANSPFFDRSTASYNVGSIFKICVAAAAVESGVSPDKTYFCGGSIDCGNIISCHKKEGHGELNMRDALALSCNVYFIQLARDVGARAVLDMAYRLGLADDIELFDGDVAKVNMPNADILCDSPAALANFSIGQGELLSTPLHLARMTAAVASGGILYEPCLIKCVMPYEKQSLPSVSASGQRVMSQETAGILKEMMIKTVQSGTGASASPKARGAGGKTATAQTGIPKLNGQTVDQAWFSGFYPADDPKWAICVLCEDAASGSVDAAPVFKAFCDTVAETVCF